MRPLEDIPSPISRLRKSGQAIAEWVGAKLVDASRALQRESCNGFRMDLPDPWATPRLIQRDR